MRSIWHVSSEEEGEIEGMFTEEGELLGMWSSNDASWRNEYFSSFMEALGVVVMDDWRDPIYKRLKEKLESEAREMWG